MVNTMKHRRKKLVAIILVLLLTSFAAWGMIAAYFSDYFQDGGNLTSDTFEIDVQHEVYLNGTLTSLDDIDKLNPGDVIVIKGSIANLGGNSAWVRETVQFAPHDSALVPYFEVYDIEISQSALLGGGDYADNRVAFTDGFAASGAKVLDGAGEDFETESGGGFYYVGAAQYNFALTIYFVSTAGNEAQGETVGFLFTAQALQFKNNNSAVPTETAWAAVTAR